MEERTETPREERRRSGEDSRSHIDEDAIARSRDAKAKTDGGAGHPAELRERGDRKGGSTSGNG